MTAEQKSPTPSPLGPLARCEKNLIDRVTDFNDPRQEWRRLFSELLGTSFLVLAAADGGMRGHAFPGVISHGAAVVAPARGPIAGAVIAVGIAFVLRGRGDKSAAGAARRDLLTEVYESGQS
jgi:aquaporin Z